MVIKVDIVTAVAGEGYVQKVFQEQRAVDRGHFLAQASLSGAKVRVHVMQSQRHGLDGVDYKP